ncbi:MAG: RNA methyltransferase [Dehalococcoidales bacterium]|jgi:TrmH family RNA methyltransferase|nr:RNA methyltransferase [Dehalococcoidales bacterium]MDD3264778.1 RNA methyltransferase [Dehalococcoidales bacterium]MDD4322427.1 RNA methyltransferase [Dehalococcoidales bacterium]MDD4794073.1 RNA methyltransferase [Dehalococcoidales bacterium]MDD5122569.1 RNA methyltransferase [Dehalococcoidales bacterium]
MQPVTPLKWYKTLATREGRIDTGFFAVEGMRHIRQIADTRPDAISELVAVEGAEILAGYPVRRVTERQFFSISYAKAPQGIMAVVKIPRHAYSDQLPASAGRRVLLLEDVQDPGNLGTLIRTAAAFQFSGIIMSDKCADPFSPKCVQSAAGSVLVPWLRRTSRYLEAAGRLKEDGYHIIAGSLEGESEAVIFKCENLLIAVGNEGAGLSGNLACLADRLFKIPVDRKKAESLNVAVSGAIMMYLASSC